MHLAAGLNSSNRRRRREQKRCGALVSAPLAREARQFAAQWRCGTSADYIWAHCSGLLRHKQASITHLRSTCKDGLGRLRGRRPLRDVRRGPDDAGVEPHEAHAHDERADGPALRPPLLRRLRRARQPGVQGPGVVPVPGARLRRARAARDAGPAAPRRHRGGARRVGARADARGAQQAARRVRDAARLRRLSGGARERRPRPHLWRRRRRRRPEEAQRGSGAGRDGHRAPGGAGGRRRAAPRRRRRRRPAADRARAARLRESRRRQKDARGRDRDHAVAYALGDRDDAPLAAPPAMQAVRLPRPVGPPKNERVVAGAELDRRRRAGGWRREAFGLRDAFELAAGADAGQLAGPAARPYRKPAALRPARQHRKSPARPGRGSCGSRAPRASGCVRLCRHLV